MSTPLDPWTAQFEFVGKQPITWLLSAKELKRAADVIGAAREGDLDAGRSRQSVVDERPKPSLGGPYMLLAGFALENLIKGILVGRDPSKFPPKRGVLLNHDLLELLQLARIPLHVHEQELVKRLTRFTTWAGRYPTPIDPTDMVPRPGPRVKLRRPDGGVEVITGQSEFPGTVYPHDPSDVNGLFEQLRRILEEEEEGRRQTMSPHTENDLGGAV